MEETAKKKKVKVKSKGVGALWHNTCSAMPELEVKKKLVEYPVPRVNIKSWEEYFAKFIVFARSHGATHVEAHRNIDDCVFLSCNAALSREDDHLISFMSLFLGHHRIMQGQFHILTKSSDSEIVTECCGLSDEHGISSSQFSRKCGDRVPQRWRLQFTTSVSKRVKWTEKDANQFIMLLLQPTVVLCDEEDFIEGVYAANYFNCNPRRGFLPENTPPLVLKMCQHVKIIPNDKTSPIQRALDDAIGSENVDVNMDHENQNISGQAKVLFYDASASSSSDRPIQLIVNGVHLPALGQQNLAAFSSAYPQSVKIYIFINGADALQLLKMPSEAAIHLIRSCVLSGAPLLNNDAMEYDVETDTDNGIDEVENAAQSMSQVGMEDSTDDVIPKSCVEDESSQKHLTISGIISVGDHIVWVPKCSPDSNILQGIVEKLLRHSYYGSRDVSELNYLSDHGMMVYSVDDNPTLYEVRIETINILRVRQTPASHRDVEDVHTTDLTRVSETHHDDSVSPPDIPATASASSNLHHHDNAYSTGVEALCELVEKGPPCPSSWIVDFTVSDYTCNACEVNIVLIIKTWDDASAYLTSECVAVEGAPLWMQWWVDDPILTYQYQKLHFLKRAGFAVDAGQYDILITVRHPLYDANKITKRLIIPLI